MSHNESSICATCNGKCQIIAMWDRPGGAPGNGYIRCPTCSPESKPDQISQQKMSEPTEGEIRDALILELAAGLLELNPGLSILEAYAEMWAKILQKRQGVDHG